MATNAATAAAPPRLTLSPAAEPWNAVGLLAAVYVAVPFAEGTGMPDEAAAWTWLVAAEALVAQVEELVQEAAETEETGEEAATVELLTEGDETALAVVEVEGTAGRVEVDVMVRVSTTFITVIVV